MITQCINFHKIKLKRPTSSNIIQIQFSYIKDGINENKLIHFELEKYVANIDINDNEYNKEWVSDNLDIFSNIDLSFETDNEQVGGSHNDSLYFLYNYNKNNYAKIIFYLNYVSLHNN